MIKKMNLSIAISRNYDKVALEFLDEPIEHDNEEELKQGIRKRLALLKSEVEKEFGEIQKWVKRLKNLKRS